MRIAAHKGAVTCLAASADGRRWISGGDREVKIFDAETGTELAALAGPTADVRYLAAGADGRTIVAATSFALRGEIVVWRSK
jgi:WD40 repeat protein